MSAGSEAHLDASVHVRVGVETGRRATDARIESIVYMNSESGTERQENTPTRISTRSLSDKTLSEKLMQHI